MAMCIDHKTLFRIARHYRSGVSTMKGYAPFVVGRRCLSVPRTVQALRVFRNSTPWNPFALFFSAFQLTCKVSEAFIPGSRQGTVGSVCFLLDLMALLVGNAFFLCSPHRHRQ